MDGTKIEIDKQIVDRLKRKIIVQETLNLKTKAKTDQEMVNWIKGTIEEEVQCLLNQ